MYILNSDDYYVNRIAELEHELSELSARLLLVDNERKDAQSKYRECSIANFTVEDRNAKMMTAMTTALNELESYKLKNKELKAEIKDLKENIKDLEEKSQSLEEAIRLQ